MEGDHAAQENKLHYVGRHLCTCKQGTMLTPVHSDMSYSTYGMLSVLA
jgi:hypothetical protein